MEEEWHLEIEKRSAAWKSKAAEQDKEGQREEEGERWVTDVGQRETRL